MREFQIAVFPGDGIGREVMAPCLELLQEAVRRVGSVRLLLPEYEAGADLYRRTGESLPAKAMEAAASADAILLGAMGLSGVCYPDGTEIAPQLDLREKLDLYAGVRPIRAVPGVRLPLADRRASEIDFVIVHELTEGLFANRRLNRCESVAFAEMQISVPACERLFKFAMDLARKRRSQGRPGRVAYIDQANVLPAMVLLREIFFEVAARFSDIETECVYVDAAGLRLVREPWTFDVIVTRNVFGHILSDVGAALIGGIDMTPSAGIGDEHAVFQPCHGSAPDIAGKGLANPAAMILSGAMLLEWLGERHDAPECRRAAAELTEAVATAFAAGTLAGVENEGAVGTAAVAEGVRQALNGRPYSGGRLELVARQGNMDRETEGSEASRMSDSRTAPWTAR